MTDYNKSNSIETLPRLNKIKIGTKKKFSKLFNDSTLTQVDLKILSDSICKDLGVSVCPVSYKGKQPHRISNGKLRSKTLGDYNTFTTQIRLYKHTAKTSKVVANKTTLDTLLHEICHHLDFKLIGLKTSKHTAGFYKRISSLKKELQSL